MAKRTPKLDPDRVTVTLAPGQREALERIAARNTVTLAHVVRYAVKQFLAGAQGGQLKLEFPPDL